jgi:hypothetical protein
MFVNWIADCERGNLLSDSPAIVIILNYPPPESEAFLALQPPIQLPRARARAPAWFHSPAVAAT